ncbi:MAG TPA: preprotein translocase subunit SecY [Firmicutes bacterium]|nr:preprotein translocase subunit SecY [Bacillota bacterium]
MFDKFQSIFRIPELRRRILFTIAMLVIFRIGSYVPVPGIDRLALAEALERSRGTLLGLYDMFAGGAFRRATIFALGIMPYISASIIMQLLTAVIPYFEKLHKEGEEGRRKITQYTRYGTVFLSMLQAFGIANFLMNMPTAASRPIVPNPSLSFMLLTMVTLTSGTIFLMWLGEQISEKGIGNGISLLIFTGIIARYPNDIVRTIESVRVGSLKLFTLIFLLLLMVMIVAGVVVMTQAMRKIPVQYAKRVIGRRIYGGQSTHIPLRVNTAGVIPIIFAQSILMFPSTIATFFRKFSFMETFASYMTPASALYNILYAIMIIFFAYFYTAIVFNPQDLADNMQKYGGFIPGIRPGRRTSEYIDRVLTRVTLPGALFLAFIAILPSIFIYKFQAPFYFGGTGLLIVVGVALDTLQQIESHLIMRHYEGFLRKGRLRGRR